LSFTPIIVEDEKKEFMPSLNRFQLEGRYPDYLTKMHNLCNKTFTLQTLSKTKELREWLLKKLQ
jgi:hypothetical protein